MSDLPLPSSLGVYKRVSGGSQTAGAEVADTVPAGKSWFLLSVQHVLTKGGTGTPQPILQIADQSGAVAWECFGSSSVQAVNTTCTYTWAPGLPQTGMIGSGTGVHATSPMPPETLLGPGWQLKTTTINTVGGTSSYGTPSYFVCELG